MNPYDEAVQEREQPRSEKTRREKSQTKHAKVYYQVLRNMIKSDEMWEDVTRMTTYDQ